MPDAAQLIRETEQMKSLRSNTEQDLRQIRDYILPIAGGFGGSDLQDNRLRQNIVDSYAEQVAENLAGALLGLAVAPSREWGRVKAADPRFNEMERAALWFEDATRRMHKVFNAPRSGFYLAKFEQWSELVGFGTGPMFIGDHPGRGPVFTQRSVSECYIAEDDEKRVNRLHRWFKMSARQAVDRWGAAAGEKVAKAAANDTSQFNEFEFLHATYPRTTRDPRRLDARNMEFASVTISTADKTVVHESGFTEFPWITPRWRHAGATAYGQGCGHTALKDVRLLQRSKLATIRAAEKSINPPLQVPDDGVSYPIDMRSGGINKVRPDLMLRGDAIRRVDTGARVDIGKEFNEEIKRSIDEAFFKPLIQLSRDPRMTASQWLGLQAEALRVLSPFIGRLHTEDLGPVFDRTFAIMLRAGMFAPLPPELEQAGGVDLEIQFVSPMARAQKLEEVQGISQTLEVTAPLGQVRPDMYDNIDVDLTFRSVAETLDWPRDTLAVMDKVEETRRQRAEDEKAKQSADQLFSGLAAAGKSAPALQLLMGQAANGGQAAPASQAA